MNQNAKEIIQSVLENEKQKPIFPTYNRTGKCLDDFIKSRNWTIEQAITVFGFDRSTLWRKRRKKILSVVESLALAHLEQLFPLTKDAELPSAESEAKAA